MKILITSDLYTTNTNGVVTSIRNLMDELKKKGHEVRVLTFSENTHSRQEGDIYYLRSMPFAVYPNLRMPLSYHHRLVKELIQWKPDVIHSQCEFFSYQHAMYVSKRTGAPIVHTFHTLYEQYVTYIIPSKKIGRFMLRVLLRQRLKKTDGIVAPTHKVEDTLQGYGLQNSIFVVPSGINLEQHKKRLSPEARLEKRRALGFTDDQLLLLNLGRLGEEKRVDELLDYFAKAVVAYPNLRFMIVGDGPAKKDLEKQAEKLGIAEYVHFTGMVDPSTVQEYYQMGDVFISASTSETQGLTYVEAAANGLPLLCREDPCLDDVIEQGVNGYTYRDVDEFTEKVGLIMADPGWCKTAGERSRVIADFFDKSNFGDSIEKVYEAVLEAKNNVANEEN